MKSIDKEVNAAKGINLSKIYFFKILIKNNFLYLGDIRLDKEF